MWDFVSDSNKGAAVLEAITDRLPVSPVNIILCQEQFVVKKIGCQPGFCYEENVWFEKAHGIGQCLAPQQIQETSDVKEDAFHI